VIYKLSIVLQIIKEFCQWIERLGGEEKSQMTKDTVQHLFEISFDAPAATSLCVRFEELPVVPENVARARNLPEVSIGTRQSSSACASLPGISNFSRPVETFILSYQLRGRKICQNFVHPY
jgi:hypothetical protein